MDFIICNDYNEAWELVHERGYVPINCNYGIRGSITDSMELGYIHNIENSNSAALRSYKNLFGSCKNAVGFVVAGIATADVTFAAASLMGIIPHPNHEDSEMQQDYTYLAKTIDFVNKNGLTEEAMKMDGIEIVLTWDAIASHQNTNNFGFEIGVWLWKNLLTANYKKMAPFYKAHLDAEKERHRQAIEDFEKGGLRISREVLIIQDSDVNGFREWFKEAPVVLVFFKTSKRIIINCRSADESIKLFGSKGLIRIIHNSKFPGWWGKQTIGYSPHGQKMTINDLLSIGRYVADYIEEYKKYNPY